MEYMLNFLMLIALIVVISSTTAVVTICIAVIRDIFKEEL